MSKKNLLLLILANVNCAATHLFLKMPNLNDDQLIERRVQSCAVRPDGIRLEAERMHNKLIIHNYGYGSDGLCFALGGAQESVQLMELVSRNSLPKDRPIAIIGAGVVGISVAQELLRKGYKVTMYAQDFPPHTNSTATYGMYTAQTLSSRAPLNKNIIDRIKKTSWIKLQELAESFVGVKLQDCFDFNENSAASGQSVDLILGTQLKKRAVRYSTCIINGQLFVPKLFEQVRAQGAKCEQRSFNSMQEIISLPELVIFNCTGFGARELCKDTELQIVQTPLICFKNTAGIDYASIRSCNDCAITCAMIPAHDCIIMRGTFAAGQNIPGGSEFVYKKMLELMRFENQNLPIQESVWVQGATQQPTTNIFDESLSFALKKLNCKGGEKVLLWGCNNHATCAQLIAKVPYGSVLGADTTPRLIEECQNRFSRSPNISFRITNRRIQEFQVYDYAVMLMSLHMPLDQEACDSLYLTLKQKGGLLLMVPTNNQHPLFTSVRTCLKELYVPRNFDPAKAEFNTLEANEIKTILNNTGFKSVMVSESICPLQFPTRNSFYEWIYQCMGNIECLNAFDLETKKTFFANVVDQYLMRYVSNQQEGVRYDMPFVLVYAQK